VAVRRRAAQRRRRLSVRRHRGRQPPALRRM